MIMTYGGDEQRFGEQFLSEILDWITEQFELSELYTDKELKEWIVENYTPDELWSHEELVEAIE